MAVRVLFFFAVTLIGFLALVGGACVIHASAMFLDDYYAKRFKKSPGWLTSFLRRR